MLFSPGSRTWEPGEIYVSICLVGDEPEHIKTKNSPELSSGEYPANAVPALL